MFLIWGTAASARFAKREPGKSGARLGPSLFLHANREDPQGRGGLPSGGLPTRRFSRSLDGEAFAATLPSRGARSVPREPGSPEIHRPGILGGADSSRASRARRVPAAPRRAAAHVVPASLRDRKASLNGGAHRPRFHLPCDSVRETSRSRPRAQIRSRILKAASRPRICWRALVAMRRDAVCYRCLGKYHLPWASLCPAIQWQRLLSSPLIRCSEGLSSCAPSSPEECLLADAGTASPHIVRIRKLKISESKFLGNSPWTQEFQPLGLKQSRICLSQTL